jgi:hypothetical protein
VIDYWKLVKEYRVGDMVQRFAPGTGGYALSPFLGRVTAVHRGLGVLDVQWPYGNERVFPDDIVPVSPKSTSWFPPALLDQTYMSLDTERARQVWASASRLWRTTELPAGFHVDLARVWAKGASEVHAYDALYRKYGANAADEAVRDEVQKFYLLSHNMSELRIQQFAAKTAAYWAASNRQYRATSGDLGTRKPACPKCGKAMRKATYKMTEGKREHLFACPRDLFLIKQTDLLGPGGEPVEW